MDIETLKYYIAVCKYSNISKAAEKVHISQSSLSRRLASLEDELGTVLINRSAGKFELTPEGRILLEDAQTIVRQEAKTIERINQQKNAYAVRVGFSQNLYMRGFLDTMYRLRELFPDRQMVFSENSSGKIMAGLEEDRLDLIYTNLGLIDGLPDIRYYTVISNDIAVLVPRGHRLWNRASIKLEELDGEQLCVLDDDVTGIKTTNSLIKKNEDKLANIQLIRCNSSMEMLTYSCVNGVLSIAAVLGNSEKQMQMDRVRTIPIDCEHMNYGDMVLACHEDNKRACEMIEALK